MTEIRVIPATADHAKMIAPRLINLAGVCDLFKKIGRTPDQAVAYCIERSPYSFTGFADDEIGCVFGLQCDSFTSAKATPWMHPTALVAKHRVPFLKLSRGFIEYAHSMFQELSGEVQEHNVISKRWLQWLGAEFSDPHFSPTFGMNFQTFRMVRHA